MEDFFEIDFLHIESKKSGDAIPIRYYFNETSYIHVVDGGYKDTGEYIVKHINEYYDNPKRIDNVIVTHPDKDHCGGLLKVIENFDIGTLWMLRPWNYATELIERFSRFTSIENLEKRLKEIYPSIASLEELALEKEIQISEPFQGEVIGQFIVMAPTKSRYLDLIIESDKTPESKKEEIKLNSYPFSELVEKVATKIVHFLKAVWGAESFSSEETSPENEMSVIQYANLCRNKILLTGDAGRSALIEAENYAKQIGLKLPGIDKFQVPHHGSRRNISSEILDFWLGPKLPSKPNDGEELFSAIISAAKEDEDHPRKAVVRAFIHRGARVVPTKGDDIRSRYNAPNREGWNTANKLEYPDEQEE